MARRSEAYYAPISGDSFSEINARLFTYREPTAGEAVEHCLRRAKGIIGLLAGAYESIDNGCISKDDLCESASAALEHLKTLEILLEQVFEAPEQQEPPASATQESGADTRPKAVGKPALAIVREPQAGAEGGGP